MKAVQLSAIAAAVLASSAALAADPIVVIDDSDAVVYEVEPIAYQAQPVAYQTTNAGVIRSTPAAVVGGTKTFFQTVTHPAAISAEVGSLGYGANIAWGVNDKTELQAGWAGGDVADLFGGDFDAKGVNYDVDTDFSNPYLGVQLRPMANWFTMGAGVIVPDNEINVRSNLSDDGYYSVNGQKYYVKEASTTQRIETDADGKLIYGGENIGTLEGSLEHRNKLAPYATIGFRPNITNNFGVFGELGAAYLGKVDAKINRTANNPNIGADTVANQAERDLEDKNFLEWLPIVKLGATYRF